MLVCAGKKRAGKIGFPAPHPAIPGGPAAAPPPSSDPPTPPTGFWVDGVASKVFRVSPSQSVFVEWGAGRRMRVRARGKLGSPLPIPPSPVG